MVWTSCQKQPGTQNSFRRVVSGNRDGESKVANGGGAQDFETVIKYVYPPSNPTHRSIKESPLSSDAIFKQVFIIEFLCYLLLSAPTIEGFFEEKKQDSTSLVPANDSSVILDVHFGSYAQRSGYYFPMWKK